LSAEDERSILVQAIAPLELEFFWNAVQKTRIQTSMATITQDEVLAALKDCYDPEIPVNIVDLGLIYNVRVDPAPEQQQDVTVDMTLTAQGCPAHVTISEQVKARLQQIEGVRNSNVNIVWSPPWTPERLSEAAKKQLGIE
jgi:metal-sulfur cluster biosynthetic enzyme